MIPAGAACWLLCGGVPRSACLVALPAPCARAATLLRTVLRLARTWAKGVTIMSSPCRSLAAEEVRDTALGEGSWSLSERYRKDSRRWP